MIIVKRSPPISMIGEVHLNPMRALRDMVSDRYEMDVVTSIFALKHIFKAIRRHLPCHKVDVATKL